MKELISYDYGATTKGKDVKETKMLEPGAREAQMRQSGGNELKRWESKHPAFGKLGAKGHP